MKKPSLGDMRERIEIQKRSRTPDDVGGFTEAWTPVATAWASVEPASSSERFFAGRLEGNVTHNVRIRFNSVVASDMRIAYRGRILKILGVINEDELSVYMTLNCQEGAGS